MIENEQGAFSREGGNFFYVDLSYEPIHIVTQALSLVVKLQQSELYFSHQSSSEVNNARSSKSSLLYVFVESKGTFLPLRT